MATQTSLQKNFSKRILLEEKKSTRKYLNFSQNYEGKRKQWRCYLRSKWLCFFCVKGSYFIIYNKFSKQFDYNGFILKSYIYIS